MKNWWILLAILAVAGCGQSTAPEKVPPRPLSKEESTIVTSDNAFGLRLFRRLGEAENGKNLFISPLSVSMALGMTLNGADGATRDSMAHALELAGLTEDQINGSYRTLIDLLTSIDPKVDVRIANSVWARSGVSVDTGFAGRLGRFFSAPVTSLDMASPAASPRINRWVSDATGGRIPSIVPDQIPGDLVMYLIDAIYFKGSWSRRFDPKLTTDGEFKLRDGSVTSVKMMRGETAKLSVASGDRYQIVDLPYGDGQYSMTIILPRPGVDVDALIAGLDASTWSAWLASLRESETMISMPRFKLTYESSLNDVLMGMGMAVAFTTDADFTRMSRDYPKGALFIGEVRHKTFVEVNEEGTEAAAATSVGMVETSAPEPIVVNRPFICAIRERHSGAILFIGRILDPTS